MLVGKTDVDVRELEVRARDKEEFIKYSDSLIPKDFIHIKAVIDNQRYLCCLLIRASNKVSWEVKKELLDRIMPEISIVGFTDTLIEVNTLFGIANMDKVEKYYRKRMSNEFC